MRSDVSWLTAVRRLPFTAALAVALVVVGVATGSMWGRASDKSWYREVAFGLPALREGKWWTPLSSAFVEPGPWLYVVAVLAVVVGMGWAEWQLGTVKAVLVGLAGHLVACFVTVLLLWLLSSEVTSWRWAEELAESRATGVGAFVVSAVAVASATVRSPWRLRVRVLTGAVVAIAFLFQGTLASVEYVVAAAIMLVVGEKYFATNERGFMPRTRREVRMLGCAALLVIAGANLLVFLFPGSGPLGPTDSGDDSVFTMLIGLAVNLLIADQLRRGKRWAWWVAVVIGALNVIVTVLALFLVIFTDVSTEGAVTLGTTLLWVLVLAILIPGRFAFAVPWRVRQVGTVGDDDDPVERVRELLRTHGGGTMSWMTTWPGNSYQFTGPEGDLGGQAVVTYQKHVGTMLALADPVCAPERLRDAVGAFVDLAESSGTTPCWFSIGSATSEIVTERGWLSVQIAEDTIVDLPGLEFKGKPWQHVRSAMNKATKQEISTRMVSLSEESFAVRTQVRAISEEWVGDKGLPEMGFTLGSVEEAMDPAVRVALAVDPAGNVHGVLSWLPVYAPGGEVAGWTLDIMRRRTDGFGPVVEYLIASSAVAFKDEGAQFISLSGAPLARTGESDAEPLDKLLDTLGAALEPYYGFRSLHTFKKKFNPRYEPVYLAFRDESDLPRIGLAVSRAYLPDATAGQLVRLAASGHD
ncbi:bifunctional lysylphosphatidylglycerol flippase/synthetase MprF [Gordonia sp. 'Campus']|uniref:bifunctional lysylphosphatidylglycerol flippase/synthetase MprF n=1 Tax=Gordonia sp. 'Campus' TaxID=2915824 RepID=UPI001EE4A8E5|nr:phosphatidylglycerol lysyltransferase domain-containing protein [Gordonia sp. 'Campus']